MISGEDTTANDPLRARFHRECVGQSQAVEKCQDVVGRYTADAASQCVKHPLIVHFQRI